jgi:hypothetical protein
VNRAAVAAALMLCTVPSGFAADTLVSETCRQGMCDRQYLKSMTKNADGTVTAAIRYTYYNNDNGPADPPSEDVAIVSCAPRAGFVRYKNGQTVSEPTPQPSHATCEPDGLWQAVCGRRTNPLC